MPKQNVTVLSIRRDPLASDADEEIAEIAYDLWLARGFRGGSPEEDLLTAVRVVREEPWAGLFLVPRRKSMRSDMLPPVAIRLHSRKGPQ
ncbi:MAG: DUF2934 domain-containing protein [Acidobacteriia bacterium]|nr:DUF2934 domain-containing protein [Terriglobia bacterium]